MICYLTNAKYLGDYRFLVVFSTGEKAELDLKKQLLSAPGVMGELFKKKPSSVRDFYLDPWPTLAWKCGYDIAPEKLYEIALSQKTHSKKKK
ncbi:MAG TPA: DUF2442 domain-containing protein [Lentisphaeria bacterium]|nr:MAG: hypothetical protein A2X45_00940 [Lentisphaerae bacterium GWF2_50_93]HCE45824.1 DUF2442 domain-containing protein [Lentisphaeria bacterium]